MRGKDTLMAKGARKIIKTCATVSKGEKVLIITDLEKIDIANLLAGVLSEDEIQPVIMIMFPNKYSGQEPPEIIAQAMIKADVIIMPVTRSISHSYAVHNALEKGVRVLAMSGILEEQLYIGGINADFEKQRSECNRFADYFTNSDKVTITSTAGTNLTASIGGRLGNSHPCIVDKPGAYSSVPNIEANVAPLENTSEGRVVVDGSIPNFANIGIPRVPIEMEIKEGSIKDISGGNEAIFLNRLLKDFHDPTALNIAQIAIGLNPEIKEFNGIGSNDHGVYGSVHIGLGTSHNLGGTVKAPLHYDVMISNPTVIFDNKKVIDNGNVIG